MRLLNYSGGIDSLYCLLFEDYDIVHHCSIINHEGRAALELASVQSTLRLIRARRKKPFEFIHTTYNYGNTKKITRDMHVIGFQTGVLMGAYPIDEVIVSFNKEEMAKQPYMAINDQKRKDIIKATAGREPKYLYPIAEMSKKELIEKIPDLYMRQAWFCRRPKRGKPCGVCQTCNAVLPHLK